ncbi:hypothetical protein BT96DRAFT_375522 [Gymnopus androsaceus JB14]|uniref:RRM domain-containing protein n=1 Tax=Gymnopus androsaceus JB14 TaxID=1447944 RepID=A0A6A4ILL0_9AGAR|nr:hypothetical protein BT96DRAFT_375522 [Gymnopus androsaceus JB14]
MRIINHRLACCMKKSLAHVNNSHDAMRKSSRILDAKKAADKRKVIEKRKRPSELFCAYVGNIHPLTTIEDLVDLFEPCEGLYEIRLRIAQGSVLRATEHTVVDELDVQYATVALSAWNGLVQTMAMNGTTVRGRRLVVGLTSAVLPETDRIIYEHYHGEGSLRRKKHGPLRPEPTEIIIGRPRRRDVIACNDLSRLPRTLLNLPITIM